MDNPVLSLKVINDIENRINNNSASEKDFEDIDFLISSIGGETNYIKTILLQSGVKDFKEFIYLRTLNSDSKRLQISKIEGALRGAISFLKDYTIKNKFIE